MLSLKSLDANNASFGMEADEKLVFDCGCGMGDSFGDSLKLDDDFTNIFDVLNQDSLDCIL